MSERYRSRFSLGRPSKNPDWLDVEDSKSHSPRPDYTLAATEWMRSMTLRDAAFPLRIESSIEKYSHRP